MAISEWISGDWVQAMGWTLIHSLWQGALLYSLAVYVSKKWFAASSQGRYLAHLGALLSFVLINAVTFIVLYSAFASEMAPIPVTEGIVMSTAEAPAMTAESWSINSMIVQSWIVKLWLLGLVIFAVRLCMSWYFTQQLRYKGVHNPTEEWISKLESLKSRMGLKTPVRLIESSGSMHH